MNQPTHIFKNALPPCEHCQFEYKPSPENFHIVRWHEADCSAIANRTPERQP